MASQVILDGDTASIKAPLNIMAPAPTINLRGFNWGTVDSKFEGTPVSISATHQEANGASVGQRVMVDGTIPVQVAELSAKPTPAAPPFPLTKFQGAYAGNGFNTIWRPRPTGDKTFGPNPVDTGGFPDDNILELNLTTEQLTFGETIGAIPNRGLFQQPDITLQGFMYLQTIQDVTNIATGRGDNPQITDIHFEPGMWLSVPASKANPVDAPTLARMASIPHGTTINAQGLAPAQATSGPPIFETIDITPFQIGKPSSKVPFPALKSVNNKAPRLPQDLSQFNKTGTITDTIIKNPNQVLANAIKGQTIKNTITFEVSTGPPKSVVGGGGTANISFLVGKPPGINEEAFKNANADAALMSSKFWIETVEYSVDVPRFTTSNLALLKPKMDNPNAPTPTFLVAPPPTLPSEAKTIKILGTQLQYSQTVNLNFATLTWPHVSVATLVPQSPQFFPMT